MNVGFGCCYLDETKLKKYVSPIVSELNSQLICVKNPKSMAIGYNFILNMYKDSELDVLILLHDDLEITDPNLIEKIEKAFSVDFVELVGVAGGKTTRGLDWWSYHPIGHQTLISNEKTTEIDFGERSGYVYGIEGSIMILSKWCIENIKFDESFTGFYAYDCDYPRRVIACGKKVWVADIDTKHHSQFGFKSPELEKSFGDNNRQFKEKWNF